MWRKISAVGCSLAVSWSVNAAVFDLPIEGSSIVGNTQYHKVEKGETLSEIAKKYDIGFLALMAANRGVDPFLPQEGFVVSIPAKIILPKVAYEGIVVNLAELRLYYFLPDEGKVHIFPVGIGRIGRDTPVMKTSISSMRKNPTWTPPAEVRREYKAKGIDLPAVVQPGPDNPLGDYAMRLAYGAGDYLIHGTNKDFGIGMRVSAGCIRMEPKDIEWLFQQVDRGIKVQIINEPIKFALEPDRSVFIEVHEPLTRSNGVKNNLVIPQELSWWLQDNKVSDAKARAAVLAQNGVPVEIATPQWELVAQ